MSGTPDPSNPPASADKPTKRTGPKGDFGGHRYTFLQDHLEKYYGKVQSVTTHHWWPVIYSEFWARFDWRSHANILLNQPIDEDSFSADAIISHGDDDLLSEIEADMKAKTMKAVNSVSGDLTYCSLSSTDVIARKSKIGLPIAVVNVSPRAPKHSLP